MKYADTRYVVRKLSVYQEPRIYELDSLVKSFYSIAPSSHLRDPIYQPLRSGRIWHKVNF